MKKTGRSASRDARVQLFKSQVNGEFFWRLRAPNGRTLAHSEGYKKKVGALKGVDSMFRAFKSKIEIEDLTHAYNCAVS